MSSEPELGLRERKKVRTRSAIQHHALRLFREQGYEATTISQIADAAEVSESTFFRYFPTKEAVVLSDDFDEALVEAFRAQPAELRPIEAIRRAVRETFSEMTETELADARERAELVFSVPALREAVAGELVSTMDRVCDLVAARVRRPAADIGVRALAGAVVGAMLAVVVPSEQAPGRSYVELMDAALAEVAAGFPFAI